MIVSSPLVSVIIPVYNASAYIAETLQSCINQSYTAIEIIVVNDGSVDTSEEIIRSLADEDYRIHYFFQQNSGSCFARNFGLQKARGEFVFFLDSDDLIDFSCIEKLINSIDSYDLVWCDAYRMDKEGEIIGMSDQSPIIKADLIISWMENAPWCGTVLLRRDIINVQWNHKYDSVDEFDFFVRIAMQNMRFIHLPEKLFYYRNYDSATRKSTIIKDISRQLFDAFIEYEQILMASKAGKRKYALYFSYVFAYFLPAMGNDLKKVYSETKHLLRFWNFINPISIRIQYKLGIKKALMRFIRLYYKLYFQ